MTIQPSSKCPTPAEIGERGRPPDEALPFCDSERLQAALDRVCTAPHPAGIFDAVVDAALGLVSCDRGSLMLFDANLDAFVIRSQRGLPGVASQVQVTLGEGVAGWVAQHGEAVFLQGRASADGRFASSEDRAVRSSLSTPVRAYGYVVGVLNVGHSSGSTCAFDESDRAVIVRFARHSSFAIQHGQLWEQTAKRYAEDHKC